MKAAFHKETMESPTPDLAVVEKVEDAQIPPDLDCISNAIATDLTEVLFREIDFTSHTEAKYQIGELCKWIRKKRA